MIVTLVEVMAYGILRLELGALFGRFPGLADEIADFVEIATETQLRVIVAVIQEFAD